MPNMIKPLAVALVISSWCGRSFADNVIDTDGPDFVESAEVVGKHRFQIETGFNHQSGERGDGNLRTSTTPTLLRYGVSDTIELRLETDGGTWQTGTPGHLKGMADTAIGFKWHMQDKDEGSFRPAVSWILHAELPTGNMNFRGRGVRPSLRSVISWDLPDHFALGVMPGIRYDTQDDGHRFYSGIFGLVFGRWWTDSFRTFVELSAPQIASGENGGVILYDNVGVSYLLTNNWQLGGRAGWHANENTPGKYYLISIAAKF